MKPPSQPAKPTQAPSSAEIAKARREAEKAAALRANLARRKAQARAHPPTQAEEKDPPCR